MGIATAESENRLTGEELEFLDEMAHKAQLENQLAMESDPEYQAWLEKMENEQSHGRPDSEIGMEHRRTPEGDLVGCEA